MELAKSDMVVCQLFVNVRPIRRNKLNQDNVKGTVYQNNVRLSDSV
jgi:hypothetical protein